MALPGSILPALLLRWSLADRQAGLLFFFSWMGTSVGALLVRRPYSRSVVLGSLLMVISGLGMASAAGAYNWSCFAWMGLFGLGLGLTMTSVSLLQSARYADKRSGELNRLNLAWSVGACLAPTFAEHSLRVVDVRSIFVCVASFFALFGVAVALTERDPEMSPFTARTQKLSTRGWPLSPWPLLLVCAVFLPTGIESSMGGWTAAYVDRSQQTILATVTAGSCFWIGLMVSRTVSSWLLSRRPYERAVLLASLATVVLGFFALIASSVALGTLVGVFLIGLGLGPVYPLLLAMALEYSENTAIFFIAGLGSALVPWLTGEVSSRARSLRTGLFIPFGASILMLLLSVRLIRSARKQGEQHV